MRRMSVRDYVSARLRRLETGEHPTLGTFHFLRTNLFGAPEDVELILPDGSELYCDTPGGRVIYPTMVITRTETGYRIRAK